MSRNSARRLDWWLVGCAVLGGALTATTLAVVVSDEGFARATFVAPDSPEATPAAGDLFTQSSDVAPAPRPNARGVPESTRFR